MIDARYEAAQATGDRRARERGWAFDRIVDAPPMWVRALVEITRARSLIIMAVIALTVSVWWL